MAREGAMGIREGTLSLKARQRMLIGVVLPPGGMAFKGSEAIEVEVEMEEEEGKEVEKEAEAGAQEASVCWVPRQWLGTGPTTGA